MNRQGSGHRSRSHNELKNIINIHNGQKHRLKRTSKRPQIIKATKKHLPEKPLRPISVVIPPKGGTMRAILSPDIT